VECWGIITGKGGDLGIIPHLRILLAGALMVAGATVLPAAEPVIDTFTATPSVVKPGETVSLAVDAHDPDCPGTCTTGCGQVIRADLTQWDASLGSFDSIDNGVSGSPYSASAVWRAPSTEGTVTVTITLADSGTSLCGGRQTTSAQVVIKVSATAGQEPVITSLTVDHDPVLVDGNAQLQATAVDPQGDPVTFSWSAALGTVSPGSGGAATYHAPAAPGRETVTCTASDPSGNSSSKTLDFTISNAVAETALDSGLAAPFDVGVNEWGDLAVTDAAVDGLDFVNPVTGEFLGTVRVPGVTSVAGDWLGRLVVGTRTGLLLLSATGSILSSLDPGAPLGPVTDVAIDQAGHRIWVLYGATGRVVSFDGSGTVTATFGRRGKNSGEFREPVALAWSPAGEVLVADAVLGQVLVFDPAGNFLKSISSLGNGQGELTRAAGVAVGPGNVLYVSDAFQSWIQTFNADGSFRESLGTYGDESGRFHTPMGLAVLENPPRLAIASVNSSSVQIFRLDGTEAEVPQAEASPALLDFGDVTVGQTSEPRVVKLTNTGPVPVGIYGIHWPAAFETQTTCGDGLAPGESCTATVVFDPVRSGRVAGDLSFQCSGEGSQTVALQARGIAAPAALAQLSPGSLDFGTVAVGHSSGPGTLTLSNAGGGFLDVTSVQIGGEDAAQFVLVADPCTGATIGPGESCTLEVRFSPDATGHMEATLTVESTSSGGPVTATLSGEGGQAASIPTVGPWGLALMAMLLALAGWAALRRRTLVLVFIGVFLAGTATVQAVDPPHWYFGIDCASCHTGHHAAGGSLTTSAGNVNLCQSCHSPGGLASALPINSSDRAVPGQAGTTHRFDVPVDASQWGAQMPTNPEMVKRIMNGNVVCSTCHDQHKARASNRGQLRVSPPERITSLGSTGQVTVGGTYTGAGGSSYLIEITIANAHFRYSKDGGSTWAGEADIGTGVPLDNGLTVTFSGGTFVLGERWRFSASYPFLRAPLDQGDNTSGDKFCRDCHSLWTMDYNEVEVFDWKWKSHPVGVALNANGRGYDRSVPLDGNGAVQGGGGGDGVSSDNLRLDAGGRVQCLTCHGVHYADSNTFTEDGP